MPKGSSSPASPAAATVAEVADWLGISTRRVKELRADGVLPGAPNEPYDLKACVRAYCSHIRPASGRAAAGGADGANALDQAKIAVLEEQRERLALLNEQIRGDAVQTSDLEAVIGAVLDGIRTRLLAHPRRVTPMIVGKGEAEVLELLTEEAHGICGDAAALQLVAAVKDRARRRASRGANDDAADAPDGAPSAPDAEPVG